MTNHGGCAILNEMITYPDRKETRKKFQKKAWKILRQAECIQQMKLNE